jgi:hypothetical protein
MPLLDDLQADFPWLQQLGFTPAFFQDLVASSSSSAEIITQLRAAPQYRQRFPGLWRQDGSVRMTEAQYLAREQDMRNVLRQFGMGDQYSTPSSLVGFFESEMDPNELRERLEVYDTVKRSGRSTRDAFYVYAGLRISDDDLYDAVVDPAAAQRLSDEYNKRVASSQFDYTTWITRATEVGLERVTETLTELQRSGAVTGTAVQAVLRTDPNFARTIMDALYTGGDGTSAAPTLNLQELITSFEYAAIGAAATNAGLGLPTKERIAELRAAGVDRAKAQSAYQQFAANKGIYEASVQRVDGGQFGQQQFEDATMLGSADAMSTLQRGLAREEAAGQQQGQFRFDMDRQGRLEQAGFRPA